MGEFHEPHVVEPDRFGPLFGVIVGAIENHRRKRLLHTLSQYRCRCPLVLAQDCSVVLHYSTLGLHLVRSGAVWLSGLRTRFFLARCVLLFVFITRQTMLSNILIAFYF